MGIKTEYRTCDMMTIKGIKQAEKLHIQGWTQIQVTPFTTKFMRRIETPAIKIK